MILPPEYTWLESFLNNDSLWFEEILNWEEVIDMTFNEFSPHSLLTNAFFVNSYFFTDFFTKLSFLDIILLIETNKFLFSQELYNFFIWDLLFFIQNKFLSAQFFFYSDYQDFIILITYHSPELVIALVDYINFYWINSTFNYLPSAVFDLFNDSLNLTISEFIENLILFFSFIWIMVFFINIFRLVKWNNPQELYFTKIIIYFYTVSKETRVQFEAAIQTLFFFIFYWSMMIATFDDDKEEFIELFDTGFFYFFCLIIFYLFYKYSIHYFAFLEASVTEGRSVLYLSKQFFRDFINTFALLLRFFILLFRLNVYDTLDDFYDSYYIYVGDFDDDEYYFELFFSYYPFMFFQFDAKDDDLYSFENENEFAFDLFYLYFLCWAKFFTFLFFILEEILRLSLAFYICYLIIFEVHAVNISYVEDFYFITKRNKFTSHSTHLTTSVIKL